MTHPDFATALVLHRYRPNRRRTWWLAWRALPLVERWMVACIVGFTVYVWSQL